MFGAQAPISLLSSRYVYMRYWGGMIPHPKSLQVNVAVVVGLKEQAAIQGSGSIEKAEGEMGTFCGFNRPPK